MQLLFPNHYKDSFSLTVMLSVVGLHILLIGYCCLSPFQSHTIQKNQHKICIQTISLKEQPAPKAALPPTSTPIPEKKAPPKAAEIKPKPNPTPSITVKKTETLPASKPVEKALPKETKRQEMLKKAKETLQQAVSSSASFSPQTTIKPSNNTSKIIGTLESDSMQAQASILSGTQQGTVYQEALIGRLKSHLQMPEYGSVDIELTLNKAGKVLKLKVLRDESANNRRYVEKHLPTMLFPPFDSSFHGKAEHTFVIRLCNET